MDMSDNNNGNDGNNWRQHREWTRWAGLSQRPATHVPGGRKCVEVSHIPALCPHPLLYLAGPMTGYPEFNFPTFNRTAAEMRALGFAIFNPAENDAKYPAHTCGKTSPTDPCECRPPDNLDALAEHMSTMMGSEVDVDRRAKLADDIDFIVRHADGVVVLDGWKNSSGARAEVAAALAVKLPVAEPRAWKAWVQGDESWRSAYQ